MIRVLYCMETIESGGVEQRRLSLAKYFDKSKYQLKIICTKTSGFSPEALAKEGVEIFKVGVFSHSFHLGKYLKVLKIIREFKPHIIHGAVFEGISMAAIGGFFGGVPVIILEETSDPQTRSKKAIFLQKILSTMADRVIGISPSVVGYLKTKVGITKSKIVLINNGVSIPKPSAQSEIVELKNRIGIGANEIVIGSVGRVFDAVKRFSDILLALSTLKECHIKFLLVGSGPDLEELKKISKSRLIEKQFITMGYQANPHPYYGLMDIFCLASAHEGFGLVVAEAMLHRLPVVATEVGGLKDIVVKGETGFLVPPKDPTKLAEKLKVLINNPSMRKQFGEAGYHRAMENYTADRYCKEIEELYLELLKEKGISI